jgi:2,3-bisphosphoglycerate-independent phosphoglycerate mutase
MKKIFMLIIDGVSDDAIPELEGRTPLEIACTPHIEYLARSSAVGMVETAFDGYPVESLICIMGLLGYDPQKYYPHGRSSFEAMARGIALGEGDVAFRCNIVHASAPPHVILDFTSGMISDTNAKKILSRMRLPEPTWELYPGQSYRNLLIVRQPGASAEGMELFAPHMHQNEPVERILPRGQNPEAANLAGHLSDFIIDSYRQIANMGMEECEGNMLWFWSPSGKPQLPAFKVMHNCSGAVVAGLDFMHGLAMAADMYFELIPGATGYIDTDYRAKAEAAIKLLGKYDFVLTHVNATDEAAHMHSPAEKIRAIESADREILAPVFHHLRGNSSGDFSIIICGDHKTRCGDGKHVGDPVPYLVYDSGNGGKDVKFKKFTEKISGGKIKSLNFLGSV